MLHEQVETDILGEEITVSNCLVILTERTWVHLYLDLSLIGVVGLRDEEPWHWESLLHDVLRIFHRGFEKSLEIFEIWVGLIIGSFPFIDSVTFPNTDVEECVEQKNNVVFHRIDIKEDRSCLLRFKIIAHQSWLDHD